MLRFAQNPRDRVRASDCCRCCQVSGRRRPATSLRPSQPTPSRCWPLRKSQPRRRQAKTDILRSVADEPAQNGRRLACRYRAARLWYEPHLDRIHEDADTRKADLLQLEQIASGYPSRERFLTELTLDPPYATIDQAGVPLLDEDYLILSTIHSAKGQEWRAVFILNVVMAAFPPILAPAQLRNSKRSAGCFTLP